MNDRFPFAVEYLFVRMTSVFDAPLLLLARMIFEYILKKTDGLFQDRDNNQPLPTAALQLIITFYTRSME